MNLRVACSLFLAVILSSCTVFADERINLKNVPYIVKAETTMENSEIYENMGLNLYFYNNSEKKVEKFSLVFFLFDEDGEIPSGARGNIMLSVESSIDPHESIEDCISLDKYVYVVPEEPFNVDYVYISKIQYDDGSVWNDPMGLCVFR